MTLALVILGGLVIALAACEIEAEMRRLQAAAMLSEREVLAGCSRPPTGIGRAGRPAPIRKDGAYSRSESTVLLIPRGVYEGAEAI